MTATETSDPTKICEDMLRANKAHNIEKQIFPSENAIIDRLLARRLELIEAYAEVHQKLRAREHGMETILGVIPNVAAFWNPDRVSDARNARNRLEQVNCEISEKAAKLAELLDERSEIGDTSGFASDTHYHIAEVIDVASTENGFYRFHLKNELAALRSRFDLKYWPSLADLMRVIAQDADYARTNATDPLTSAATRGSRGSRADFFKALFVLMEENRIRNHGYLPNGFKLSDNALASFANCALDLGPNDLVDGAYVKRLRQREREARKAGI